MRTVSVSEAKAQFSSLLDAVKHGETITITKHGVPVARLVPPPPTNRQDTAAGIQALRQFRQGITLGDVTIRELIEEGR